MSPLHGLPNTRLDKEFSVFTLLAKITIISKQRHNNLPS